MAGKCNCSYPEIKYSTWTGHAYNCPLERAARRETYPRCKEESKPPDNLSKFLRKIIEK